MASESMTNLEFVSLQRNLVEIDLQQVVDDVVDHETFIVDDELSKTDVIDAVSDGVRVPAAEVSLPRPVSTEAFREEILVGTADSEIVEPHCDDIAPDTLDVNTSFVVDSLFPVSASNAVEIRPLQRLVGDSLTESYQDEISLEISETVWEEPVVELVTTAFDAPNVEIVAPVMFQVDQQVEDEISEIESQLIEANVADLDQYFQL
jgi:hypothetical protein